MPPSVRLSSRAAALTVMLMVIDEAVIAPTEAEMSIGVEPPPTLPGVAVRAAAVLNRQPLGLVRTTVPLVLKSLLLASEMTTAPSVAKAGATPFCARSADTLVPPEAGVVLLDAAAVIAPRVRSTAAVVATRRDFIGVASFDRRSRALSHTGSDTHHACPRPPAGGFAQPNDLHGFGLGRAWRVGG